MAELAAVLVTNGAGGTHKTAKPPRNFQKAFAKPTRILLSPQVVTPLLHCSIASNFSSLHHFHGPNVQLFQSRFDLGLVSDRDHHGVVRMQILFRSF